MKRAMALAEREVKGPLSIGSVNSIGIYLLPEILTEFHRTFPDVQIHLEMQSSSEVIELLQENHIEVALIAWNRKYPQLASSFIMQNSLMLVGHPKNPLTRKRGVKPEDLSDQKFIGYEAGTPTRMMIDSAFKNLGMSLSYVLESTNIATIKHLAIEGMGLAFLPEIAVELELKEKTLRPVAIEGISLERPITLYWKERRSLTRPAEEFIRFTLARAGVSATP
jgi:DNA-binding transcriptional LysR family regulator